MPGGIDREHGERKKELTGGLIDKSFPNGRHRQRFRVSPMNPPSNGFAGYIIGLVKTLHDNQAKLAVFPRISVTGFFSDGFTAGIVGS